MWRGGVGAGAWGDYVAGWVQASAGQGRSVGSREIRQTWNWSDKAGDLGCRSLDRVLRSRCGKSDQVFVRRSLAASEVCVESADGSGS